MTTYFSSSLKPLEEKSPEGLFDYSLVTPMRAMGTIGFIIKKVGLLGIDYEFVDYSSAHLRASKYSYSKENRAIREKYGEAGNLRIGTEWRINFVSVRAGVAYYGIPFKNTAGNYGSHTNYTAGIGFREKLFFIDIAYILSQTKDRYYFYDPDVAQIDPSNNNSGSTNVMITLGLRF